MRELLGLGLPADDYVIGGSGVLLAHGFIDAVGDLDLIARGAAWREAVRLGGPPVEHRSIGQGVFRSVRLAHGVIEVMDCWLDQVSDIDGIFATADDFCGLRLMSLDLVVATKRLLKRPQDLGHLRVMDDGYRPGVGLESGPPVGASGLD